MRRIEYDLPVFEGSDKVKMNEYTADLAEKLKVQIDRFGNPLTFKGQVATLNDLPDDATPGDIYNVTAINKNYVYSGDEEEWLEYSSTLDLSEEEQRISELEESVAGITADLDETSQIHFIASTELLTNDFVGDCCLITGKKNILIDVGNQLNCATLIAYLQNKNINKLDYIIISHYHNDHVGGTQCEGFLTLLNQSFIDFSECEVLLPHKDIDYTQFVPTSSSNTFETRENIIINALNSKNIAYKFPSEGEEIILSKNEKITFYNTDDSYYTDYYNYTLNAYGVETGATNYNNFSMICIYEHFSNVAVFTGDIEKLAQSKNYKHFKNCDILKIEHHGLNFESDYNYLNQLNPKYAVVCNSGYYNNPFDYAHATTFDVTSKGAKLYATRNAGKTIVLTSAFNKITSNVENINQLNNMQYSLWVGQEIKEGDDLNDPKYMIPGIYFCMNNSVASTLLNRPKTISNGEIGSGFKMIVEAVTGNSGVVRQTIYTAYNDTNRTYYRTTINGGWTGAYWGAIHPSNLGSLNTDELEQYWVAQHTNYSNRLAKRNAVVSLSLNCKIDQQLSQFSVLLKIPFDILETGHASYYFLAFASGITQPITLYTNRNDNENVTEIKNYDAIPANTDIRAFVTIVEEKF